VAEAKAAANEAAAKYTEAQSMFEQLGDEIAAAEESIAVHEAEAAALQALAEHRAVTAYTGRDVSFPVELEDEDVMDSARRTELLERVNARDNDAVDALAALTEDLEAQRAELAEAQEEQARLAEQFKTEQEELDAKVAEAEAAVAALAEQLRIQKAISEAQALAEAQATRAAGSVVAPDAPVINGLVCPVPGASFSNDWGDPRSGGRVHQGNDLFAPTGTAALAVIGGTVSYANEGLGGLVAYLAGSNGNTYYYGHFSQFVGGARTVAQGEVIGLVGQTGNAQGPHVHFEIRVGGGSPINPYPTLASIC